MWHVCHRCVALVRCMHVACVAQACSACEAQACSIYATGVWRL